MSRKCGSSEKPLRAQEASSLRTAPWIAKRSQPGGATPRDTARSVIPHWDRELKSICIKWTEGTQRRNRSMPPAQQSALAR